MGSSEVIRLGQLLLNPAGHRGSERRRRSPTAGHGHVSQSRQFTLVALAFTLLPGACNNITSTLDTPTTLDTMSSANLFRSQAGNGLGPSNGRASTPTNFSGLLARSEALGSNPLTQDGRDSSELPQIHYGIGEIERQSEAVAGRGKRKAGRGEG